MPRRVLLEPIVTPAELRGSLAAIAGNLAYGWSPEARDLFQDLDPELWRAVERNPTALLAELREDVLARAAADRSYAARVARVRATLAGELARETWWERTHGGDDRFLVAYFSAEFGIDESLPIYSGGLGVLAGDHLKSASELGLPLVGVGLLYRRGYFRQGLDEKGWQVERYPDNDPAQRPLVLERDEAGAPLLVHVDLAGEQVAAQIWRAQVGRVELFLLDTDVEGNGEDARRVTDALYGGDREHRIRQEIVLGVGGVRALRALGIAPTVFHMNEGHSAFLALERVREYVEDEGRSSDEAWALVRDATVFTTHTPVPAGNEVFDVELVRRYVAPLVARCGIEWDAFLALGSADDGDDGFGLTPLALRASAHANGVSALHGSVSRAMWAPLWPERDVDEVPIGHVTNGVHARTWLSAELRELLGAHGVRLEGAPSEQRWRRVDEISERALWRLHRQRKQRLIEVCRPRLGESPRFAGDPDALTIGFARRFATYKRAQLLFSDPERLARLLDDPDRPVQILIAGKAHPADEGGKRLIEQLVAFSRNGGGHRVVFIADYEMTLARYLVQGVDVWLNTPRRPMEASGTSGMKAAMNGVLNVSILDGWWCEGYTPAVGWAFGSEEDGDGDEAARDAADRDDLFRVLEQEVVPAYYERGADGVPYRWVEMMKASIGTLGGTFNTGRMVWEYAERFYLPAHRAAAVVS